MRHTLMLVVALGLIAVAAPAIQAQESTTAKPATTSSTEHATPAPATAPVVAGGCCQAAMAMPVAASPCCQPGMTGSVASPAPTVAQRRRIRGFARFRATPTTTMPAYDTFFTPYQSASMVNGTTILPTSGTTVMPSSGTTILPTSGTTVMPSTPMPSTTGAVAGTVVGPYTPGTVIMPSGTTTLADGTVVTSGLPMTSTTQFTSMNTAPTRRLFWRFRR
jgi:hypothetical protein